MPSLLHKSSLAVRPRIAVELRPEGVYAARGNDAGGVPAQVASAALPAGSLVPSLRPGNLVDRIAVIAALKRTLTTVQLGKGRDVTLIVPDTAVRVLLLDFDELPSNPAEAMPLVRFRLAKLLPFPAAGARVSYQVMSRHALVLQVLVVAMPEEVLAEYESAMREAGFEPGAVLPSTLAVAAALDDAAQTATLLVNGSEFAATTAIVRRGELLLHRTLELKQSAMAEAAAGGAMEAAGVAVRGELGGAGESAAATMVQASVLQDAEGDAAERASLELLQAISVAAAYFEDSLAVAPAEVLTAGTVSAAVLSEMLADSGMVARDTLQAADVPAGTTIRRGLLAGVRGALKS